MNVAGKELPTRKEYDVVVVGVGAGGLAAAAVAANEGLDTLVLEKTTFVGGTMSYSGGMAGLPDNPKKGDVVGLEDALDDAKTYLDTIVGVETGVLLRQKFRNRSGGESLF